MKTCNKKGFTMVELLAVISIIAILAIIAITSIAKILSTTEEEYYKKQENLMLVAGKDYFNDNPSKKPQDIGEETCVSLDTLYKNNYIGQVKDYNKNDCDMAITSSGVCAKKITTKKYTYYSYLKCAGTEYIESTANPPTITIIKSPTFVETDNSDTHDFTYQVEDTENNLVSYRYIIYDTVISNASIEADFEIKKDSGWIQLDGVKKIKKTITIKDLLPGYYKIKIQAYNDQGKLAETMSNQITIDPYDTDEVIQVNLSPDPYFTKGTNLWYNSDVTITVPKQTMSDIKSFDIVITQTDNSVGADRTKSVELYNWTHLRPANGPYTFNVSKVNGKNYGYQVLIKYTLDVMTQNKNYTSTTFNIDLEAPTCTTTKDITTWTNQDVTYTGTCNDSWGSGCKSKTITSIKTEDTSAAQPYCRYTTPGVVFDNTGNMTTCPVSCYKKDSVAPTKPVIDNPYSGVTQTARYNITATSSDPLSKIAKWQYKKESSGTWTDISSSAVNSLNYKVPSTGNYTLYLRACDNAGNCSSATSTSIKIGS